MAHRPVPKPLGAPLHLISGSVTVTDRVVLKHKGGLAPLYSRFSNHGRSGGSQTGWAVRRPRRCSVTMADRTVLKPAAWTWGSSWCSVTMADRRRSKTDAWKNSGKYCGSQTFETGRDIRLYSNRKNDQIFRAENTWKAYIQEAENQYLCTKRGYRSGTQGSGGSNLCSRSKRGTSDRRTGCGSNRCGNRYLKAVWQYDR